jgi:hypothetical protein
MASFRMPARRRSTGRPALLVLLTAGGVLFAPLAAGADPARPTTSQEAAQLVAARAHDLEVLTEQFNEAREELKAAQEVADVAAEDLAAAEADLAGARDHVRTLARSAWTGDRLAPFQALLSSDSADELLDRVSTLQTIAEHNNGVLSAAQQATEDADLATARAEAATAEARVQVDRVAAKKDDLDAQIAVYQAAYERLTAEEQRAARAAAERTPARRPPPPNPHRTPTVPAGPHPLNPPNPLLPPHLPHPPHPPLPRRLRRPRRPGRQPRSQAGAPPRGRQ